MFPMQRKLIILFSVFFLSFSFNSTAQSKEEIARVYFERATHSLNERKEEKAKEYFERAESLLGGLMSETKDANLGAMIFFRLKDYSKAKRYVELFFSLNPDKETTAYKTMLEIFVNCDEKIQEQKEKEKKAKEEEKRRKEEEIRKEKEKRKIDSLTTLWKEKAKKYSIVADTIYPFNKEGFALYKHNNEWGIVSDKGEIVAKAENYKFGYNFDNYTIVANNESKPTKIVVHNCIDNRLITLPDISVVSPTSSHYGRSLLVRGNGLLVLYPNDTPTILTYNLKTFEIDKFTDEERDEILENLKKSDAIERYKSDGRVRIEGKWYRNGGYLGGGVLPLFNEEKNDLSGFFFAASKKIIPVSELSYLGYFYNGTLQGVKNNEIIWINRNGDITNTPENEGGEYNGNSEIKKHTDNTFVVVDRETKKLLNNKKKLSNLKDFLEEHK